MDVASLMDRLIAGLDPDGQITDTVKQAIRAVPRHQFIPPVGLVSQKKDSAYLIDRNADPDDWWDTVYSNEPIVTQLNDGATTVTEMIGGYTSSSSSPWTVANLLTLLDPDPGNHILEIGTGTGWTSALLCHLVGEHGQVTSIEVDPAVAQQAAKNLADVGARPNLIIGDGTLGCPERAPYDRVHVTCGIRTVPYAWIAQCRIGATIVMPFCPNFGNNHSLRLVVRPDGTAIGRFPGFASYMMLRAQRSVPQRAARGSQDKHYLTTHVDPRVIAYAPAGADLAIAALTGVESSSTDQPDEDGQLFRLWMCDPRDSYSWAAVAWRPGSAEYEVYQVGDRPLWDEVLDAYFRWVSWGQPGRDRFGMTVTPSGQQIWLDSPGRVVA
ncbi:methyltransferase domain-containing protein [Nonomuraea sp. GTA35]|uniref:methyltransferase domain-containing protein n=1 Tax=Nonomuraea sp. GTA35 TaxID=1676746 RepID=UPI0035BEF0B0